MARHNKKRNSGLLYEFLVRSISRAMVENNRDREGISRHLVQKYFRKGTEVHREFRLINALVNAPVGNEALAHTVLHEARAAAHKFDSEKLNKEKNALIREINHKLGSSSVYSESIPNYRDYATAGTILGYWRDETDLDISTVISYETQLIEKLSREKSDTNIEEEYNSEIDGLVVKVMSEKLNKKYSTKISTDQISLIKSYIFSENLDETKKLAESIKEKALECLAEYSKSQEGHSLEKANEVMSLVESQNIDNLNDETLTRFLQMTQVVEELGGSK